MGTCNVVRTAYILGGIGVLGGAVLFFAIVWVLASIHEHVLALGRHRGYGD